MTNKVKSNGPGQFRVINEKGEFVATATFQRRAVYGFTEAIFIDRRTGVKTETNHAWSKDFKEFLVNKDFG